MPVNDMPIYEYKCDACGAVLEKIQKFSDAPLVECPQCGKDTLVKLVSAPSFRLKGSGWYETDFKTGKKKNGAGTESSGYSSGEGSTGGGSEKSASGSADSAAVSTGTASEKSAVSAAGSTSGSTSGAAKAGSD